MVLSGTIQMVLPNQGAAWGNRASRRAVERILEAHLENVEILLSYDDPRYDLVLPVPPSPSRMDPLSRRPVSENLRNETEPRQTILRKKEPPL